MRTSANSRYRHQHPLDAEDFANTADQLDEVFDEVCRITGPLRFLPLRPDEAKILGSTAFPDSPTVVRYVAHALIDHAHEFPDIHVSGAALMEQRRLADGWVILYRQFAWLTQRCADMVLRHGGGSEQLALGVLKEVQASAERPRPYLGAGPHAAFRRDMAMGSAQRLVQSYRDSLQKIRRRLQKLHDQSAPAPTPKTRPSPQKLRAQQHRRIRVQGAIYDQFVASLRDWVRGRGLYQGPAACVPQSGPSTDPAYQEG